MFDFKDIHFIISDQPSNSKLLATVKSCLISQESIIASYLVEKFPFRSDIIFTEKRLILCTFEDIDSDGFENPIFSTFPYSRLTAFSVKNSKDYELQNELNLIFIHIGKITFEFPGQTDLTKLCKLMAESIL